MKFTNVSCQVFALGFVSVFDQIIEGIPGTAAADIFQAYMAALQEDPEKYRRYSAAGISLSASIKCCWHRTWQCL